MEDHEKKRRTMVERQILGRGVRNGRVLNAMETVQRHLFVPESLRAHAYEDSPVSIGLGQTISQPYMVALMTECLDPEPNHRVLEIGTGSGYQTAILAEIVKEVHSIERIAELAERAEQVLSRSGYENVWIHEGDGSLGWPASAPFDGILVTAGSPEIPEPLLEQLVPGGRLVIPVGDAYHQTLVKVTREERGVRKENVTGCVFVPLIGRHGWGEDRTKRFC